jgi:hypothetical protein
VDGSIADAKDSNSKDKNRKYTKTRIDLLIVMGTAECSSRQ